MKNIYWNSVVIFITLVFMQGCSQYDGQNTNPGSRGPAVYVQERVPPQHQAKYYNGQIVVGADGQRYRVTVKRKAEIQKRHPQHMYVQSQQRIVPQGSTYASRNHYARRGSPNESMGLWTRADIRAQKSPVIRSRMLAENREYARNNGEAADNERKWNDEQRRERDRSLSGRLWRAFDDGAVDGFEDFMDAASYKINRKIRY